MRKIYKIALPHHSVNCRAAIIKKERGANSAMTDEEFEKHWRYHRPEIMHAGAAEAVQAYKSERVKK
jgi:hypothetical protein